MIAAVVIGIFFATRRKCRYRLGMLLEASAACTRAHLDMHCTGIYRANFLLNISFAHISNMI